MHTAKLFINGRSQAIRIPKELAFQGVSEVAIHKEGNKLILEPVRKTWTSFADLELGDGDFMTERPELMDVDRVRF